MIVPEENPLPTAESTVRKKKTRTVVIVASIVAVIAVLAALFVKVGLPEIRYRQGVTWMESGDYGQARARFYQMAGYRDAAERYQQIEACWTKEVYNTRGYQSTTAYTYDAAGNKTQESVTSSSLRSWRYVYTYDAAGSLRFAEAVRPIWRFLSASTPLNMKKSSAVRR